MKIPESLKGMRVLIVDDNNLRRALTNHAINMWKGSADFAIDGEMAVKKVSENIYDVVLMDTMMPVMNGYEATKMIRSMEGEYFRKKRNCTLCFHAFTCGLISKLTWLNKKFPP